MNPKTVSVRRFVPGSARFEHGASGVFSIEAVTGEGAVEIRLQAPMARNLARDLTNTLPSRAALEAKGQLEAPPPQAQVFLVHREVDGPAERWEVPPREGHVLLAALSAFPQTEAAPT